MLLWINSIITLIAIALIVLGIVLDKRVSDSEILLAIGSLLLVIIILTGWIVVGITHSASYKMEKIESVEYQRTNTRLIVDTGTDFKAFQELKYYRANNEDLEAYYKIGYNIYGLETGREIVLKVEK